MPVQPRLASTVMLLRNSSSEHDVGRGMEVFMVQRSVQSEFMPSVYVFPGGSVSQDDCLAEQYEDVCAPVAVSVADPEGRTALGKGVRAAAIRELFEEANVLLAYHNHALLSVNEEMAARFAGYRQEFHARRGSLVTLVRTEQLMLATDHLAYFAHWVTPEGMPKRYDTHFFLAAAPVEQEAIYDALETSDGVWIRPAAALEAYQRGDFPIAFPTFHQLRALSPFNSVQEALTSAATHYVPARIPMLTQKGGRPYVYLPDDPTHMWKI